MARLLDLLLQRLHYDFIATPDADVPQAVEPTFQHVVTTYANDWQSVPDAWLDFKPAITGHVLDRAV